ncbi:dihydroorotase [Kiritimatiellaeota bacterium B1221]|nr:dihydroorotase [Kiritimatiellaeota bacterium B1221]
MSEQLIQNGSVVFHGEKAPVKKDLWVEDGVIRQIADKISAVEGAQVLDARGKILHPGLCDPHVHLREPGREDSETIQSGSEAAIAGGYTHILSMPNTDPPIDTGGMVTYVQSMAMNRSRIPVSVAGCLTKGRKGDKLAEVADMAAQGAIMMTDCNHALQDAYVLRRALEYTRHFDVVVGVYPDTPALSGEGVMHEGELSFRLGLQGIPAMAEEIAIERELRVAQAVSGRIHIQNVSTAGGVASIRRFKADGLKVTAETTPHHLLLNHESLKGYHTRFKMMPPLRTPEDQEALLEGLKDGTLDMIATGHAPHTDFEKNLDFSHAPFGVTGLESALPALYGQLVASGKLDWQTLMRAMCDAPRKLLKLEPISFVEGGKFEAVLFDPEGETLISRETTKSRSFNSPWLGETLKGKVEQVFLGSSKLI